MSSYNELIKNFEKIRAYMRDFYVYGIKSRTEYENKSARSYDNERRRIESWLGDYISFDRTVKGKNIFLSIDSRVVLQNPFFKAWKTKSFTDRDITLHFILLDILNKPDVSLSLTEILRKIDEEYLSNFQNPILFDESTVRKKLKEYAAEGILKSAKQGRSMVYSRAKTDKISFDLDALHFFSEVTPCGVIGSFLLDKRSEFQPKFTFKHHYITSTLDSDVLLSILEAMHNKCKITVLKYTSDSAEPKAVKVVPLRVFISVQTGRQHLLAYQISNKQIRAYRMDYLSNVKAGEVCPNFDNLRKQLDRSQKFMWGVNCRKNEKHLERVEFTVRINRGEEYILQRLQREKRIGTVEQIDSTHYCFCAYVYDSTELIPWIRTFICRITSLNFSNRTVENQFKKDIKAMYKLYGLEEEQDAVQ